MNISQILNIKPLSVNGCWQGKRFKTKEYINYEKVVLMMLKKDFIEDAPYKLNIEYGFSNNASDIDNPTKPFLDILQKKYKINDKDIVELHLYKKKVKKGQEYIKFSLTTIN